MSRDTGDFPTVHLSPALCDYAQKIADGRKNAGKYLPPDSGRPGKRADLVGAMAEIAVCLSYGEDYETWVTVLDKRPGPIPDLIHAGYRVNVKGTEQWGLPLNLIVPSHDTHSDVYILVSVDIETGICGLRGWVTRRELVAKEPEGFRGKSGPGKDKPWKKWRYIPVHTLRPCRSDSVEFF